MVRTLLSMDVDGSSGDVYYKKFAGNSSDTKPTSNVAKGSALEEVDTRKTFYFNETTGLWVEEA